MSRCVSVTIGLWGTDIDGTLFRRRTDGIYRGAAMVAAQWLAHGGSFKLVSAGSAAGLARDGLDVVQEVFFHLRQIPGVVAPADIMREVSLHMSNGAATYSVHDPSRSVGDGQLEFEPSRSCWVPEADANRLRKWFQSQGLKVLAADADRLPSGDLAFTALFLRKPPSAAARPSQSEDHALEGHLNEALAASGEPMRVHWLGGSRGRYDVFPLQGDVMVTKARPFREARACERIIFTGDRCEQIYEDGHRGSDYEICRLVDEIPGLVAVPVHGPEDLVRVMVTHLREALSQDDPSVWARACHADPLLEALVDRHAEAAPTPRVT